jgi:hypothetical protein
VIATAIGLAVTMPASILVSAFSPPATAGRSIAALAAVVGAIALASVWPVRMLVRRGDAAGVLSETLVTPAVTT